MAQDPRDLVTALNLYLLQIIAQVAHDDVADASLRFGISAETARTIATLNPAQIFEISRSPRFFFGVNEGLVTAALKDVSSGVGYGRIHESISSVSRLMEREGGQDD